VGNAVTGAVHGFLVTISKVVFGVVAGLVFCAGSMGQESVPRLPARSLAAKAPFSDVLEQLAQAQHRDLLIGFEKADGVDARVTISYDAAPADEIVKAMCLQDGRYTYSMAANGRILHVFPVHPNPLLRGLLDMKLQQVDIDVHLWTDLVFTHLPDLVPPAREYLAEVYGRITSLKEQPPPLGVSSSTNLQPPRIELHLRDLTVRDLLDAFALKSLEFARMRDETVAPGVTLPASKPAGWKCELPPGDMPEQYWMQSVCKPFF
jgi:hypothetical protein